jgi:DNA repair exonuclease SbcCD ATPase subunit
MNGNFNYEKFSKIKKQHNINKVEKASIERLLFSLKEKKEQSKIDLEAAEKARIIFQKVAKKTQDNLKYRISNLVTTALHSIDKTWPEFKINIETRRNQSEIDFLFLENGKEQDLLDASGHGTVDIAADALKVSIWSLNKNRPAFIKDEPFRNLSSNYSQPASKMLKMLCDKLNIQNIIVSHDTEITDFADRVINVKKIGLKSKCIKKK